MGQITITQAEGGIATLTLERAPVNALSPEFLDEFGAALDALAAEDAVRAVVIGSAFKVFSAGLDLKEAQGFDISRQHDIVRALNVDFLTLYGFPKPVVAAAGGPAIAGGLFFVLGADWRIATPRASFGLAEVRVGANFPVGPLEIARAELAPATLRRLMLTGQPVTAKQALRQGIIDEIADAPDIAAAAKARELADLPAATYASVKRQIRGDTIARIEAAMAAGANAPEGGWFSIETAAAMQRMLGG